MAPAKRRLAPSRRTSVKTSVELVVGGTIGSVVDFSTAAYSLAISASWWCHDSPKYAAFLKLPSTTFGYTSSDSAQPQFGTGSPDSPVGQKRGRLPGPSPSPSPNPSP